MIRSFLKVSRCFSRPFSIQCLSSMNNSVIHKTQNNLSLIKKSYYSTEVETKLADILRGEINYEQKRISESRPPNGFYLTESKGSEISLERQYSDGVKVVVTSDLAGSVDFDQTSPDKDVLKSYPDFTITMSRGSESSVTFHCTLTNEHDEEFTDAENSIYRVESIEVSDIPNYYVLSDNLDDSVSQGIMDLLFERGFDTEFQKEFQEFCTNQEHNLYLKFLEKIKSGLLDKKRI